MFFVAVVYARHNTKGYTVVLLAVCATFFCVIRILVETCLGRHAALTAVQQ